MFNCSPAGDKKMHNCDAVLNGSCSLAKTLGQAVVLVALPILVGVGAFLGARFSSIRSYRIALGMTGGLALVSPFLSFPALFLLKRAQGKEQGKTSGEGENLVRGQPFSSVFHQHQDRIAGLCGVVALVFLGTLITGALSWNSMAGASRGVRIMQKISTVTSGVLFVGAVSAGYWSKAKSEKLGVLPKAPTRCIYILTLMFPGEAS